MSYFLGGSRVHRAIIAAGLLTLASSAFAGDKEHFARAQKYSPAGSNVAISFQPTKIVAAYSRLQPKIEGMPPVEGLLKQFTDFSGLDLRKALRVSYVGRQADSFFEPSEEFLPITAIFDFEGGIDLKELASKAPDFITQVPGSPRYNVEIPGQELDGFSIIAFAEGDSLIVTTSIDNYMKKPWRALTELQKHATPDNDILFSIFTPKELGEYLSSGIENFEDPENIVMGISFKRGVKFTVISEFADEKGARIVDDFLTNTIEELFKALSEDRDSVSDAGGILALAENFRTEKKVTIELKLNEPMLMEIVGGAVSGVIEAAKANAGNSSVITLSKGRRNAQNLASVSASALAAGATLDPKASIGETIQTFQTGIYGSDMFADTLFQVPHMSDAQITEAAKHLEVDPKSGNLNYEPQPLTTAELEAKQRYANSPEGRKTIGKRNAQNLASVWASASAAGADFSSTKSKLEAIKRMTDGSYGAESFSSTMFKVPGLDAQTISAASDYLIFEPAKGGLIYVDRDQPTAHRRSPDRLAQNFASTYSSAVAAGSPAFEKAKTKFDAINLLINGVAGSGAFRDTTFQVQFAKPVELVAASELLEWDPEKKLLNYIGR